jgi:hypothetical protein
MNMRKKENSGRKGSPVLSRATRKLLGVGLSLIAPVLFGVILELEKHPTLSLVAKARFAGMLECVAAAAALLLAGAYLVERCLCEIHSKKK